MGSAGHFLLLLRPDLPQPDGLVSRDTRHHGLVRAGVAGLEILPDSRLVLAQPVVRDQLPVEGVPADAGDLTLLLMWGLCEDSRDHIFFFIF